jgi:hypothetical protein
MLYENWVELQLRNYGTLEQGLQKLNATLGRKLTHSRVREYIAGVRAASPEVLSYMQQEVLNDQLTQIAMSPSDAIKVMEAVFIPTPTPKPSDR